MILVCQSILSVIDAYKERKLIIIEIVILSTYLEINGLGFAQDIVALEPL